jgi:hypothetical protein
MPPCRIITAAILAICATALPAAAQPIEPGAEGHLADLLSPKPGEHICFAREYDAAHLKAHPRQEVQAIAFRLAYFMHEPDEYFPKGQRNYYFHLSTKMRPDGHELSTAGECTPTSDGTRIHCGVDCDGGGVMIRKAAEPGSLLIDLETTGRIRMGEGCDAGVDLEPGVDDKTFLLTLVPAESCPSYDEW